MAQIQAATIYRQRLLTSVVDTLAAQEPGKVFRHHDTEWGSCIYRRTSRHFWSSVVKDLKFQSHRYVVYSSSTISNLLWTVEYLFADECLPVPSFMGDAMTILQALLNRHSNTLNEVRTYQLSRISSWLALPAHSAAASCTR